MNALTPGALAYPEYFESSWHLPSGRLPDDVPHQFRMWAHSELMANDKHGLLIATVVFSRESGRPYGAVAPVAVAPSSQILVTCSRRSRSTTTSPIVTRFARIR